MVAAVWEADKSWDAGSYAIKGTLGMLVAMLFQEPGLLFRDPYPVVAPYHEPSMLRKSDLGGLEGGSATLPHSAQHVSFPIV